MKRTLFATLILAICVGGFGAPQSPTSLQLPVRARALIDNLAAGRTHAVTSRFDARLRSALPPAKLMRIWSQIVAQAGALRSIGAPQITTAGRYRIVLIDCTFVRAHLDAKIVYDRAGDVAGLFFLPHSASPSGGSAAMVPPGITQRSVTLGRPPWTLPDTLALPSGPGPFPAVVLVAGSGPQDRDETIGPNKVFRDIAWGLAARGIAVLRYEKRTRRYPAACSKLHPFTLDDEVVDDAHSAVHMLEATARIDHSHVFVLGHSLGGMAAPRIAKTDHQIAGLIIMAGNVRPLQDLIVDQVVYLARLDHQLSPAEKRQIAAARALRATIDSPHLKANDTVDVFGSKTPGSYWLDLRRYHPATTAAALHIPILILQGGRDYQVTLADFRLWKQALHDHSEVTFKLFPSLNHLFMAGRGPSSPEEYSKPGHVDGRVIATIASWIKAHSGVSK